MELTTTKPGSTFEVTLNTIGGSLSDVARSDDGEYEEDEDNNKKDPEMGKLSEDDEHGWVMGTTSRMVNHRIGRFQQKQMKLNQLTHPGRRDKADHIRERDRKYGTSQLNIPAVVQLDMEDNTASPGLRIFGEPVETLDNISGKL